MLLTDTVAYFQDNPDQPMRDVEFFVGDSFPIRLVIKQAGTAIDLTGCQLDLTISSEKSPTSTDTQILQVEGLVDTDQVTNIGHVSFVPTFTETTVTPGVYWYGLQIISPANHVRSTQKFKFEFLQDIPKRPAVGDWDTVIDWDAVMDWDKVVGQE